MEKSRKEPTYRDQWLPLDELKKCGAVSPMSGEISLLLKALPKAAVYEQLAEECAELAKAALKRSRQLRGENPTPVSKDKALAACREEAGDVMLCVALLASDFTPDDYSGKITRWVQRLEAAGKLEEN